jgi:hypothetical protein
VRRPLAIALLAIGLALLGALWLLRAEPSGPAALPERTDAEPGGERASEETLRERPVLTKESDAQREAAPARVAAVAPAEVFTVRVKDAAGGAVSGARAALCDSSWNGKGGGARSTRRGSTDRDGRAAFRRASAALDVVLVTADGHVPVRVAREVEADEQVVMLDGRVTLAGWVRVAGTAPGEPVELKLTGFRDSSAGWCAAVRAELSRLELGESRVRVRTDASGRFELRGLPEREQVVFRVPERYRLVSPPDEGELQLSRPWHTVDTNVLLSLSRLPVLTGRAVREREGPVLVQLHFTRRDGERVTEQARTSVGAHFAHPFAELDAVLLEVVFHEGGGGEGAVLARRELRDGLNRSIELGDVRLSDVRAQAVRVTDEGGAPIAGARIYSAGNVTGRAGADGLLSIEVSHEGGPITVGAFGFELRRVFVAPDAESPFQVILQPAARLRIVVEPAGGVPTLSLLRIGVDLPGTLEDDAPEANDVFGDVRGPAPIAGEWTDHYRTLYYTPDGEGVLELSDPPLDVDIGVTLQGPHQHELASVKVRLARGERRELRLKLPGAPMQVFGTVLDADGEPVVGAVASFAGLFGPEASTDASGAFELGEVYAQGATLYIEAPGYVGVAAVGSASFLAGTFILEPARTVWVEVVDAAGERVEAEVQAVLADGQVRGGHPRGTGLYQVDGVPLGSVLTRARLRGGGEWLETRVDAGQNEVRVHLDG